MSSKYRPRNPTQVRIEQAIARGWTVERIVRELDVTRDQYQAAMDALEEADAS